MSKGISRVDSAAKRQHSWLTRHYTETKTITKQFSDGSYGSKAKALQAAQAWLREQRKLHPARRSLEDYAPFQFHKARSNTGILGISRTHDYARHDRSIKQAVFSVAYSDEGVRNCKKFYIHNYADEEEALADAVRFRREKEREMLAYWRRRQRQQAQALKIQQLDSQEHQAADPVF